VRARMLELGLDPNARTSMIPRPPTSGQPTAVLPIRGVTRLQPNALQRHSR